MLQSIAPCLLKTNALVINLRLPAPKYEGVVPSFTRLAERAGVTNSAYLFPEVTTVLESAVLSLRRAGHACVVKVA
jgi:hypothetical protein